MDSSWEEALKRLEAGVDDARDRSSLAGIVRGEIAQIERVANRRGERLKTIVEATTSHGDARRREVVIFPSADGATFTITMHVAPYDVAWFEDRFFSGPAAPTRFLLRPLPDELDTVLLGAPVPIGCTIEDPDGPLEMGDLQLVLMPTIVRRDSDVLVIVFERVGTARIVTAPSPSSESLETPITASRVCEAIASGRLRLEVQRKPDGISVSFVDGPGP